MVLFFRKPKESPLESKIMVLAEKVDTLKESDPEMAYLYLKQATRLYHKHFLYLPSRDNDRRFNEIFLSFIETYI